MTIEILWACPVETPPPCERPVTPAQIEAAQDPRSVEFGRKYQQDRKAAAAAAERPARTLEERLAALEQRLDAAGVS